MFSNDDIYKILQSKESELYDLFIDSIYSSFYVDYILIFFIDKWNIKYTVGELFKDKKFLITYIKGEEDWGFGHIIRENFLMTVDKKDDLIYFIKR